MDEQFTVKVLQRDFPGWELLGRDVDGCLFAWLPDHNPALIAFGEDLPDLMYEIRRKRAIAEGQAWPVKC